MRGGRHCTKPVHRHSSGRSWTGDARLSLSEQAAREPAVPRPPIIELDMDGIRIWILARSGADASDGDHRPAEGSKVIGSTGAVRVMVATKPVDFRKGVRPGSWLARDAINRGPRSSFSVFVWAGPPLAGSSPSSGRERLAGNASSIRDTFAGEGA
jgi:hypothetical protein